LEHIGARGLGGADDHRRHVAVDVVLRQECLEHLAGHLLVERVDAGRKMCTIPEVPATPDHRQIHADAPATGLDRDDVGIHVGAGLHRLLVQYPRQRGHAVSKDGGVLEAQLGGRLVHPALEVAQDLLLATAQEAHRRIDVGGVVDLVDGLHAGSAAATDLVQQTCA
jgi:hypothetical protein